VMDQGRLVEIGAPADLYSRPTQRFTAGFMGGRTMLNLAVEDDGRVHWGDALTLTVPWPPGTPVVVAVTPEAVRLDAANGIEGRIVIASFRGGTVWLQIETALGEIAANIPSSEAGRYPIGRSVWLSLAPDQVQVFHTDENSADNAIGAV